VAAQLQLPPLQLACAAYRLFAHAFHAFGTSKTVKLDVSIDFYALFHFCSAARFY